VCVLHSKSIPDNLTPRYSRSYKPFTEREQQTSLFFLRSSRKKESEKKTHALASRLATDGPDCFASPFQLLLSQTSFNLLFIS
jgi:hypothetical protein